MVTEEAVSNRAEKNICALNTSKRTKVNKEMPNVK